MNRFCTLLSMLFFLYGEGTNASMYFVEEPKNVSGLEGLTVTLPCRIKRLRGRVQWSRNDMDLGYVPRLLDGRLSMDRGPDEDWFNTGISTFNLRITNVQQEDEGWYRCHVSASDGYPAGLRSKRAYLSVIDASSDLKMDVSSVPTHTRDGPGWKVRATCSGEVEEGGLVYALFTLSGLMTWTFDLQGNVSFRSESHRLGFTFSSKTTPPFIEDPKLTDDFGLVRQMNTTLELNIPADDLHLEPFLHCYHSERFFSLNGTGLFGGITNLSRLGSPRSMASTEELEKGLGWWFMAITVFACFVVVTAMLATYVAKGSADKDNRRRGKSEPSADTGEAADQADPEVGETTPDLEMQSEGTNSASLICSN